MDALTKSDLDIIEAMFDAAIEQGMAERSVEMVGLMQRLKGLAMPALQRELAQRD